MCIRTKKKGRVGGGWRQKKCSMEVATSEKKVKEKRMGKAKFQFFYPSVLFEFFFICDSIILIIRNKLIAFEVVPKSLRCFKNM